MIFEYEDVNGCLVEIDVQKYVELLDKSIKHYERMIKWVKTQDPDDAPDLLVMFNAIDTDWQANSCVLCDKFEACNGCPIYEYTEYKACSGTPWDTLAKSCTWSSWLVAAIKEVKFLTKLRDHYAKAIGVTR